MTAPRQVESIRWLVFTLAAGCLIILALIPRSPASVCIAGLFLILFAVACWTYGAFERNPHD